MDQIKYKELLEYRFSNEKKLCDYASWAIWAEPNESDKKSNTGDITIFDDDSIIDKLNPHYVFVGLNASRKACSGGKPWGNFHSDSSGQNDYRLRNAIKGTKAWGGYITDIIKDNIDPDSQNVVKDINSNETLLKNNIEIFKQELQQLDNDPTIIALGVHAFDILINHFGGQYRIAKAKHFSSNTRISLDEYVEYMKKIIERCK